MLVKMAAMGERMRKDRHRVQEQRPGRAKIANLVESRMFSGRFADKSSIRVVISANPAGVPQGESRAIGESLVLEAIGHFKRAAADVNRLRESPPNWLST